MDSSTSPRVIALTIAGSDSGGGAGIQADLKTFHRFAVFGTSVVTAVTAQNTTGVRSIHAIPVGVVIDQIDMVAEDLRPRALKSGMLATAELVHAVADRIEAHAFAGYVLDPVMVASSGDRLLEPEAEGAIRERLVPLASLVTPNLHEARILTGLPIETVAEMVDAARALVAGGAQAALIKGGHLAGDEGSLLVDVLVSREETVHWEHARLSGRNTHGTGCTLSAAVTAGLAKGRPLRDAVSAAVDFVHRAILSAPELGTGHGPLNHFAAPAEGA